MRNIGPRGSHLSIHLGSTSTDLTDGEVTGMMTNNNSNDKEPVAGLSAASACIRISLGEQSTFRPVFTHQCFKDECINGWMPVDDAELQARLKHKSWGSSYTKGELHPSFSKCQLDGSKTYRIDVHCKLTPSCGACEIDIHTDEKDNATKDDGPAHKKVRTVQFEQPDGGSYQKRMSVNGILQQISLAVPPISSVRINGIENALLTTPLSKDDEYNADCAYLNEPIGRITKSYKRTIKETAEEANFVITISQSAGEQESKYHGSVQKLAKWFIETADDIDISGKPEGSDSGGFWNVMYLFRVHDGNGSEQKVQYSLAGYITLFHFHAPFKKPQPGIIVRVCQALILPPYQRAGHGSDMLQSIYEYATQYSTDGLEIVEVNVEDPAPGFVALRDSVDYKRFMNMIATDTLYYDHSNAATVMDKDFFLPIADMDQQKIATTLKITKRQAQIVHEMHKLEQLDNWRKDADSSLIADRETQYRLMIKKSLRAHRSEELGACDSKDEQKSLLEGWFQDALAHYTKLLGMSR